jgi:FkbM family methyltransferase
VISSRDALLRYLVRAPDPVIFDIGANRGQSIDDFKAVFPDARVHAFEPSPEMFSVLEGRHRGTAGVVLNQCGVGSAPGELALHVNAAGPGVDFADQTASFLALDGEGPYAARGISEVATVAVPVTTIDTYRAGNAIAHVDVCKIDTQGFTRECLEGAQQTLAAGVVDVLQLELLFSAYYERTDSFLEIESLLAPHGYRFYTVVNTDTHEIGSIYYSYPTGRAQHFDVVYVRGGSEPSGPPEP